MKAIYPGSFDPFTIGHKEVVRRALRYNFVSDDKLEKLYICIGSNKEKNTLFSKEARKKMIEDAIKDLPKSELIEVVIYDGLIVDLAHQLGTNFIIRGIRSDRSNYNEEINLSQTNRRLAKIRGFKLETIPIIAHDEFISSISSSMVKQLCSFGEYIEVANLVSPNTHQELMRLYLENNFVDPDCFYQTSSNWLNLAKTYASRAYHNLSHLGYMFNMLNIYRAKTGFVVSKSFKLAIIGHDLVHDPLSNDNEEASYDALSQMFYKQKMFDFPKIKELILATKHLQSDENLSEEQALIKDLDLTILGTFCDTTWKNYCENIRKEYSCMPEKEFTEKRIEFLSSLLKLERIFSTDFFYQMFEEQARQNIAKEIERLQA